MNFLYIFEAVLCYGISFELIGSNIPLCKARPIVLRVPSQISLLLEEQNGLPQLSEELWLSTTLYGDNRQQHLGLSANFHLLQPALGSNYPLFYSTADEDSETLEFAAEIARRLIALNTPFGVSAVFYEQERMVQLVDQIADDIRSCKGLISAVSPKCASLPALEATVV